MWSYKLKDTRVGPQRRLSTEEMFLSCGAGEDSWEALGSKEIKAVNSKRNQPQIFIGRTDAEAEALVLWPSDAKNQHIDKDSDAGKDWG